MNILELLQILSEDVNIDEFNKKVEGKISPELLDAFASRMKKGKYNNAALAVLKGIQEADEEHKEVLEKKALAIYGLFRQIKKGDSSFNASEIMDEFLESENPKTFWKEKYVQSKEEKRGEKENFGLKNVKVRELKNYYLIFPKTFKKDYFFTEKEDFIKGWKELKTISDEMAKKDTSGEKDAKVNHWCVAASDNSMFEHYKKYGGVFIVIVKKNEDGSPDWNHRYLWYANRLKTEFADKFNNHGSAKKLSYKDPELSNFLNKIEKKILNNSQIKKFGQNNFLEFKARKNIVPVGFFSGKNNRPKYIKEKETLFREKVEKINEVVNSCHKEVYKAIKESLIKAVPEINNGGSIIQAFIDRGTNKERKVFGKTANTYEIDGLYGCSFFLTTGGGNYTLSVVCRKPASAFNNENSSDYKEKIVCGKSDEELINKISTFFNSKINYPTQNKVYLGSHDLETVRKKPDYSLLNNNKYAEQFTKNMLSKVWVAYFTLIPLKYIRYILGMSSAEIGISHSVSQIKVCDIDDPKYIEKTKAAINTILRKVFPGYNPSI